MNDTALAEFGEAATYYPASGSPASFPLEVIFDEAHEFTELEGDAQVITTQPGADVTLDKFPSGVSPKRNDKLEVEGRRFRVDAVLPGGRGAAVLRLVEVSS